MGLDSYGSGQKLMQSLVAVVLVVAALFFGREVLLPLAMAVLLTFLFAPLVSWLERIHLPRIPAVLAVILALILVAGSVTWVIGAQLTDLAIRLPRHAQNLKEKFVSMKLTGGAIDRIQETMKEVSGETAADEIHPVRIVTDDMLPYATLGVLSQTVLTPVANAAIILVLLIFMLIKREDLRNRMVRLAGTRFALTTRTLDEVGSRISRYLLMNALINGGFGLAVAVGLMLIGVEYAPMWGFLAALLRFLPYVGPMLAATMPIGMAFIQFPGHDWFHPALTAGLFVVLELITNNVVEPLAYGQSTGVSTVALLVSAIFWTWVWGPMGLVLAVPLTVVLTVLGEHVPALTPLAILLGDKQALDTFIAFYQRLLAGDVDEATSVVEEEAKTSTLIEVYDNVLIPALVLAEKDSETGELLEETQQFIWQTTRDLLEDMDPRVPARVCDDAAGAQIGQGSGLRARVLGVPAHDTADDLVLEMLQQNLVLQGGSFEALSTTMLASELISRVAQEQPDAVCISSLGPVGIRQTRYLCKRLRQAHPQLHIIVGRWGFTGDRERAIAGLKRRGADQVVTSLAEARSLLERLVPLSVPAVA